MSHILQIHPDDNVAVALEPLKAGEISPKVTSWR